MVEFTLFGISVRIEPWHWISLGLIGFMIRQSPLGIALFVLAGFVSILVHEFGHALTIRRFGQPTSIVLSTFGGYATFPLGAFRRKESFLVSLAGPALQLVLGLVALGVLGSGVLPDTDIRKFFFFLTWVSIMWAVLNLLPVYPLDGGHMLKALLNPRHEHVVYLLGVILPLVLVVVLFAVGWSGPLFMIFMGLFAWQNFQRWQQHR